MINEEIEKFEDKILKKYKSFLNKNKQHNIKVVKRDLGGVRGFIQNNIYEGELIDDGFFTSKLRTYFQENKKILVEDIHSDLMKSFKFNGDKIKKIELERFCLTPLIYSNQMDNVRCILVVMRYIKNNGDVSFPPRR